jgi:hypothetical protein
VLCEAVANAVKLVRVSIITLELEKCFFYSDGGRGSAAIAIGAWYEGPARIAAGVVPASDIPECRTAYCMSTAQYFLALPNIGADEHSMLVVIPILECSNISCQTLLGVSNIGFCYSI